MAVRSIRSYRYEYDVLGRMSRKLLPGGGSVSYSYTGNSVSITDPDGKARSYTYNALGLVSKKNVDTRHFHTSLSLRGRSGDLGLRKRVATIG